MRVRVATRAVAREGGTPTGIDPFVHGVGVPWVELDGHRFNAVTSVQVRFSATHFNETEIVLRCIGPVELVYVDGHGEEIAHVPYPDSQMGEDIDADSVQSVVPRD